MAASVLELTGSIRGWTGTGANKENFQFSNIRNDIEQLSRAYSDRTGELAEMVRLLVSKQEEPENLTKEESDRLDAAAAKVLLAGRRAAPASAEDYDLRTRALAAHSWIGNEVLGLASGWIPLVELAAGMLVELLPPRSLAACATNQMKEKFGTMRWYGMGHRVFSDMTLVVEILSRHCCITCGREASLDNTGGWLLNLCDEQSRRRRSRPPKQILGFP